MTAPTVAATIAPHVYTTGNNLQKEQGKATAMRKPSRERGQA